MSEADDAFLHVHLDHMQLNSWSQDCVITSGSAILVAKLKLCQQQRCQEDVHSKTVG